MLIHYILTGGAHPFGETIYDIEINIARGWPKWKDIGSEANHLIGWMLANEPRERPSINTILRHPLFWTEKERYDMLVAVGSELTDVCYGFPVKSVVAEKLNSIPLQTISRDWVRAAV